ncbi:hypothetical protein JCM8097_009010 [Rhodosporidiobolus ruineniae]
MPPAIDYSPRHPQPVTLPQLRQLEPELLSNEITRLENSIQHLERSNAELRQFAEAEEDDADKQDFLDVVSENEGTIASQRERIHMIRLALEEQVGVDAQNPHYTPSTTTSSSTPAPPPASTASSATAPTPAPQLPPSIPAGGAQTNGVAVGQGEEGDSGMYL